MKLTKKQLLFVGLAATAAGIAIFAGPKIVSLFKKPENESESGEIEQTPSATQQPALIAPKQPEPAGLDINKKLKKGTKGEEVKRVQFIVNYIAGLRGATSYKTPGGYTVKFPIGTDADFGNNTQAGVYFAFDFFKDQGFVTLDQAREKLAYIAGYYDKPFPSELVGTSNFSKYQTRYKAGEIDGSKSSNVNLPNVGLNLTNIPTIFN